MGAFINLHQKQPNSTSDSDTADPN